MNRELAVMVRKTVEELKYRNAFPEKNTPTTSADRRYTADFIVKKSPFSIYFKYLGITKGCELKRSFDYIRGKSYFKFIYQVYCMKWVYSYDAELVPCMDAFDVLHVLAYPEVKLRDTMLDIDYEFKGMLQRMQLARAISMGRKEVYAKSKAEDSEVLQRYCNMDERALLGYLPFVSAGEIPAAALALLFHDLAGEPVAREWLNRRHADIIHWFIRNAAWRCYLALFHNVALLEDDDADLPRYYASDGFIEQITGGISHRRLNWQAAHYQYGLLRAIRCIYEVAPFPDFTKEDPTTDMLEEELYTSGSITTADVPQCVKALAQRLAKIHGPVQVTSEASGMHLYIADPELLITDGEKELSSRHMAINVDKYFGLGKWNVDEYPTKENQALYKKYRREDKEVPCCMSMKTGKPSTVSYLLSLPPVEQRINTNRNVQANVFTSSTNKNLVYDEQGNLVPEGPGEIVPLHTLEENHPAREYLKQRGFNPDLLEQEYSVGYCIQALPEDRAKGRYWSRLPAGVCNSPAGRIIFPMLDADGVRRGWQARVVDYSNAEGEKWLWTPDKRWLLIEKNGKDVYITPATPDGFKKLHKYINARGMARNEVMFGLRQAIQHFKEDTHWTQRYCVLVEGALDVAKGGPPCIALLGKNMSAMQAEQIKKHFCKVYVVADQDEAGKSMLKSVSKQLSATHPVVELYLPPGKKDLGECSYEEAARILKL